jgi:DnaJ-class molecular chaperone
MNPYAVLGLNVGATPEEAKRAFRTLAKTCHPDLHPNDAAAEARFKEISAAYEAICNPQPQPQQPQWQHFDPFGMGFGGSPFGDLFSHLRQPRNDTIATVTLSLEEIHVGREVTVKVPGADDLKVHVPPGAADGLQLVRRGAGPQSHPSAPRGDLIIVIRVRPHERFRRDGQDLHTVIPVTAFDVLLGNEVEVVGIEGNTLRVAIPANFDTTRKLRLANQGLTYPLNTKRGDLLIELYIQFPVVPAQHREALRAIARAC